jgi:hypothetical protein
MGDIPRGNILANYVGIHSAPFKLRKAVGARLRTRCPVSVAVQPREVKSTSDRRGVREHFVARLSTARRMTGGVADLPQSVVSGGSASRPIDIFWHVFYSIEYKQIVITVLY